jgi:hypothetical protein
MPDPKKFTFEVFDSFEEAETNERQQWMSMTPEERMILLETLRQQSYPDEQSSPQGLQRILSVV